MIGDTLYTSDNEATGAFEKQVKKALEGLPNGVIDTVSVGVNFGSAYSDYDAYSSQWQLNMKITFTGTAVAGPQNFLIPQVDECLAGCSTADGWAAWSVVDYCSVRQYSAT